MNHPVDSSQPDAPFSSLCGHGLKHGLANTGLATPREEIGKVEFVEESSSCALSPIFMQIENTVFER